MCQQKNNSHSRMRGGLRSHSDSLSLSSQTHSLVILLESIDHRPTYAIQQEKQKRESIHAHTRPRGRAHSTSAHARTQAHTHTHVHTQGCRCRSVAVGQSV